ncbi:formimidoylglutamate deiminase [Sphingomonas gilva]|uniref:Formimidoylglutamate deiminase n=1 Tax=Sphingomonas gilva TaxID=2305907 RepID=A0A396RPG6_9SPHN|nr:formimidoylglutamate deiminase [Sphingomonas gilva]RHW17142.1 formimidoylglutamate deiminase [Sphingomonas gilva]
MQHLWFAYALLPGGWAERVRIGIDDGRIASIEPDVSPEASDARHGAALPGLCNVHSHGFQRGMAGLSERRGRPDDDFWSWREIMYRFLDRLTPDDIAAITAQAYVEMLETGYTRVGEFHYLHNDVDGRRYADPAETTGAVVAAAEIAGIGLTLLPVFYAHGDFGGAAPAPGQRRFLSDPDSFARLVEASRAKLPADAVIGIAPHSLRAVTPEELRAILPLASDGPIHIHAAEQVREVEACLAWSGARPVEWLLNHEDVDQRWCLIHATHLDSSECDRLAASGAVAGLCPVTEANLGDGTFPAMRYLGAGGRFGTGTDSNILVDAASELRALEYSQRLAHRRRALLADDAAPSVGQRLFEGAVAGGARALGVETGLRTGAPADIVALDLTRPAFAGADPMTLLDRWIFAGGAIDTVWRGGRKCVEHGRHFAAGPVAERYRRTLERLLA